ncbi:MAG: hypothetical protein U1E56_02285 [Bauldia sp.]
MPEKIEVAYSRVGLGNTGLNVPDSWHQYLIYTDKNGRQSIIQFEPGGGGPNIEDPFLLGSALNNRTLRMEAMPYDVLEGRDRGVRRDPKFTHNADHRETLLSSEDLSDVWRQMHSHAYDIGTEHHLYHPLQTNSNSGVSETLRRAGVPLPRDNGFWDGGYSSPGQDVRLYRPGEFAELLQNQAMVQPYFGQRPLHELRGNAKVNYGVDQRWDGTYQPTLNEVADAVGLPPPPSFDWGNRLRLPNAQGPGPNFDAAGPFRGSTGGGQPDVSFGATYGAWPTAPSAPPVRKGFPAPFALRPMQFEASPFPDPPPSSGYDPRDPSPRSVGGRWDEGGRRFLNAIPPQVEGATDYGLGYDPVTTQSPPSTNLAVGAAYRREDGLRLADELRNDRRWRAPGRGSSAGAAVAVPGGPPTFPQNGFMPPRPPGTGLDEAADEAKRRLYGNADPERPVPVPY